MWQKPKTFRSWILKRVVLMKEQDPVFLRHCLINKTDKATANAPSESLLPFSEPSTTTPQ